jgi:hypothetical protein
VRASDVAALRNGDYERIPTEYEDRYFATNDAA